MAFEGSEITRSAVRISGFRDAEFDYQLLRLLGLADYGGSSAGEILAAAAAVSDGDTAGWWRAFGNLAERVEAAGRAALDAGHPVSARDHLRRAAVYHRTAEYYAEPDREAQRDHGRRSRACLVDAAACGDGGLEPVEVPFGAAALPGWIVHPDGEPRGTLVVVGGFDTSAEELTFQLGRPGAERGWRVVTVDGPGQAGCMRLDPPLTFRPDYEVPVAAVLDHLPPAPGPTALAGISFGGYLAARAAAGDRRIDALVVDPPLTDLYRYMEAWLGPAVFAMRRDVRPEDVAGVPDDLLLPQMGWGIVAVCRHFGVRSLHGFIEALDAYRLRDLLGDIRCPVLALVGEHEGPEVAAQAVSFVEGVRGPSRIERFPMTSGADAHAQAGGLRVAAPVIFDWLDELAVPPRP